MKSKTLLEHLQKRWPDADFKKTDEVLKDRSFKLSPRHKELLEKTIHEHEQKEIFLFVRMSLSLDLLKKTTCEFLRASGLEIYPAPLAPTIRGLTDEKIFLAMEDFDQKLGSVYHLIYYPESGLCIVYTYFGQLHWSPQ